MCIRDSIQAQARIVSKMIASIRESLPRDVRLNLIPTVQRPTAGCWVEGSDLKNMAALFDGFDACAYQKGAEEIFQDAWDVRNRVGTETQLNFVLRPASPTWKANPNYWIPLKKSKPSIRLGFLSTITDSFLSIIWNGLEKHLRCYNGITHIVD